MKDVTLEQIQTKNPFQTSKKDQKGLQHLLHPYYEPNLHKQSPVTMISWAG